MTKSACGVAFVALVAMAAAPGAQQPRIPADAVLQASPDASVLKPTSHPPVPRELGQFWFVPDRPRGGATDVTAADVTAALRLHANGEYTKALPVLSRPSSQQGTLGLYAMYDMAEAQLALGLAEEARRAFQTIGKRQPIGYLSEAAAYGEAESDEALKDPEAAIAVYERLLKEKIGRPDEVRMRLAMAAKSAGQLDRAAGAFARVYYEFAFSEFSTAAGAELGALPNVQPIAPGSDRYKLELGRAERVFGARQYAPARTAFEALRRHTRGDDRELVDLRIAEANYFLKRTRDARDGVRPYLKDASRQAEALYFHAVAARELGDVADYLTTVRRIADDFPKQSWAEDALNNLATHYILADDDVRADETFRELYAKYPRGSYAERAAWKIGWRAYRQGAYAEAATFFERAAADFPRSDYRPPWLYWSGRAHEALKDTDLADARYTLAAADYLNSYYGRLAAKRRGGLVPAARVLVLAEESVRDDETDALPPPNGPLIRALVGAGLYDEAINELRYAQRTWGDSSAIQATLAWISHEQGLTATGPTRFTLLRGAITTMRRAYPQFMAAGGEQLPREILRVIFPLQYWDLIQKYAAARNLDPYLVAALVAQESTFAPDVRSSANAVGLMQLLPSTARPYARKLKLTYSASLLTNPEANIRMGIAYFADKITEFGAVHLALASYNAGEGAVRKWMADRPGVPPDEFIDDIPYAETQSYVKRIVGTAEDYRRLYGK